MTRVQDRKWKANLLNYEWIEQQEGAACYCLSAKSAQMLLTISQTLAWATRWEGNEFFTDEQREQIFKWANDCEAELMNGCCGQTGIGPKTRVTINGTLEVFNEITQEWEPYPEGDPREQSVQFPPLQGEPSDALRCAAAKNIRDNLTEIIDTMITEISLGTAITGAIAALLAMLAVWVSLGTLLPLVTALAAALLGVGAAGLETLFDSELWDKVQCAFYCQLSEEGVLTQGGYELALAEIQEEIDPAAWTVLSASFANLALLGINNMATIGVTSSATCGDCDCGTWCWFADFMGAQAQGFEIDNETGTQDGFLGANGWTAGIDVPNSTKYVRFDRSFAETTLTKITMNFSQTPDDCGAGMNNVGFYLYRDGVQVHADGFVITEPLTDYTVEWVVPLVACDRVLLKLECGCFEPYGSGSVHNTQFEGMGEPIEEPNCEE